MSVVSDRYRRRVDDTATSAHLRARGHDRTSRPAGAAPASRATRAATPRTWAAWRRAGLLALVFVSAWVSVSTSSGGSLVPAVWPPAGVAAGLLLTTPSRLRPLVAAVTAVLLALADVLHGADLLVSVAFAVSTVAGVVVVRAVLVAGRDGRRAALMDQGDVSRMIGAIALGSATAAAGHGATVLLAGEGNPWLAALSAAGSHAAALMVLLPLFLEKLSYRPLASTRERGIQTVITIGTSILVFTPTGAPQLIFAVMPMFAWHAFRGTLRESTLVLSAVGVIGTGMTMAGLGPVHAAGELLDLPPELSLGVLQLFLLDCGLILLPLSVMVTQQRLSAAHAEAERETLERLVDAASGTAVVATGTDGTVRLFNPGAEKVFGRTADDVVGRSPETLFSASELERQGTSVHAEADFRAICEASVALGIRSRLWQVTRPSGEDRTIRMTLNAVPDSTGGLSGYLATAEDVTEREAAHRALLATLEHERKAVEQLRELERTKGDFVATVSHELRTPITSIMGYTEVLEDGDYGELTHDQLEILNRVDKNSRRLLLLVEDLLTLSKIESSTLRLQATDVDLRTVVRQAHDALLASLVNRDLDVRVYLPAEPVRHHADAHQLERMILNLLTNAAKFTPDGGTVDVVLHDDAELREIVVRDTGMGIPQREQAQLFTRFFRSTTATKHAIQGTGLGLSIVQAIVSLHGGTISVDSAEGRGTTFTVTLPRFTQAIPPTTTEHTATTHEVAAPPRHEPRQVVSDQHVEVRAEPDLVAP